MVYYKSGRWEDRAHTYEIRLALVYDNVMCRPIAFGNLYGHGTMAATICGFIHNTYQRHHHATGYTVALWGIAPFLKTFFKLCFVTDVSGLNFCFGVAGDRCACNMMSFLSVEGRLSIVHGVACTQTGELVLIWFLQGDAGNIMPPI